MITSVYLDDQQGSIFTLVPNNDITVTAMDLGYPDIREVIEPIAGADGVRDTTELYGSRAVSIDAELYNSPAGLSAEWRAMMAPSKRVYLYVSDTEWGAQRRILLRAGNWSDKVTEGADDIYREVSAQWRAPTGVWESPLASMTAITAYTVTSAGIVFPRVLPLVFAAAPQATEGQADNTSGIPIPIVASLYGPCDGPILENITTGNKIVFRSGPGGLALNAGEFVRVDTRERTANYLGVSTDSRLAQLDYLLTQWWRLQPGINRIRYTPTADVGAGAQAVIEYRLVYL